MSGKKRPRVVEGRMSRKKRPRVVDTFDYVAEGIRNRCGTAWLVWYDVEGKLHWQRLAKAEADRVLKVSHDERQRIVAAKVAAKEKRRVRS